MLNFSHDLRYALRTMRRNPGVSAIAVLALGLGIGANTAVFTVLNGVLFRPLPFPEADRLLVLSNTPIRGSFRPALGVVESQYLSFERTQQGFEGIATFNPAKVTLTGAGEATRLACANVTASFFPVLRVRPVIGRSFREREEDAVLLSDRLWRSQFRGDSGIVGKPIKLDGVMHTVVGVMPAGFRYPYDAELWTPLEVRVNPHNAFYRPVVARLRPGTTAEQASAEFVAFAHGLPQPQRNPPVPRVVTLKSLVVGDVGETLRIFAGAVAFVLLIACANVANLLLMRAQSRRQEIAVRVALGAGRGRLVRQLLTESLVISTAGGAVGILLALWGVPALVALSPKGLLPRLSEIHIDAAVLAFTVGVSMVTGLLFGAAPAIQAARRAIGESLGHSTRVASGSGGSLRNALAVAEIALALVLLTGAGLMMKSLWRMHAVDPGFRADDLLTMTVTVPEAVYREPADIKAFHARVLEKLAGIPGVSAAAAINSLPLAGMLFRGDVTIEAGNFPPDFALDKLVVSEDYFRAMGIRIFSGRGFSERDTADAPHVALISQSAVRALWPGENPLGKRISESNRPKASDWYTIVGVVDDVRQVGLTQKADPAVYFGYRQSPHDGWLPQMTFVMRTPPGDRAVAPAVRAAVRAVDADQPIERMASMQDLMTMTGAERTFQARLMGSFAALALALAVIGVYGVLAYSVAMRTREIGIRMALGARAGEVLRMVLRRTLLLAGAGLALGTAGALFATRLLEKMLFEVKPSDTETFVAVAVVLGAAALAAGWIPARRAAQVDPLVALRYE